MKEWQAVAVAVLWIGLVAGCVFMSTKPTTEEQKITLELINQTGLISCALAKEEWPDDMIVVQTVLRDIVLPQLNQGLETALRYESRAANQAASADVIVLSAIVDPYAGQGSGSSSPVKSFNWPIYISPVLALAKLFAIQMGVLDTSATYYEAVRSGVVGCLSALE